MKSGEWKTYRTRFLVQAKQLNSALSFVDPLGRTHCGRRGDYLVESSDGVISIAPRQIFEDIYVPISPDEVRADDQAEDTRSADRRQNEPAIRGNEIGERKFAPLPLEKKKISALKLPRSTREEKLCACPTARLNAHPLNIQLLDMEEIELRPTTNRSAPSSRDLRSGEPARARRKMPQPAGDRTVSPRLGLM
jgi:hypothetical protein